MKAGMLNSQLSALEEPGEQESYDVTIINLVKKFGKEKDLNQVAEECEVGLDKLLRT
jgi:gluconate kinase